MRRHLKDIIPVVPLFIGFMVPDNLCIKSSCLRKYRAQFSRQVEEERLLTNKFVLTDRIISSLDNLKKVYSV